MADRLTEKAAEIAELVIRKRALYGDSFGKTGEFLRMLYPNGIKPEQYDDMLTITRVFDKLCRAATSSEHETESPWDDVMGYALLAATRYRKGPGRTIPVRETIFNVSPMAEDLGGDKP